ncbi:hypothetical protein L7D48_17785 [Streptomyces sp. S1A]|uniref:hypothetical protein n=1 Tax=Streptomyces sp. ICN903 TaxID=2964654 RepID=UPI001EDBABDF|nr:hypothetical protein [Streptomyces sp. ICN903]MCG3042398.1 hypothetical protein [Streptomyces sp. ICN903]
MSKQRFVAAGVAAVALAGLGGTAFALQGQGQSQGHGPGGDRAAARPAAAPERPAGKETTGPRASSVVRVVEPYEPVEIGQGALMGLLPEGRQNYVVSWGGPEAFREDVEFAKGIVGDDIRPNTISGGYHSDEGEVLFTGAFRTDVVPGRITVRTADGTFDAKMLRLPGDPGWGAYHLDAGRTDALSSDVVVTAYAPDGGVIDTLTMTSPRVPRTP